MHINDFENIVIDELTQERLRQSRVIAQQTDTIGKLHRALSQFTDRDYRRFTPVDSVNVSETFLVDDVLSGARDDEVQTDLIMPGFSDIAALFEEHKKLQTHAKATEIALQAERAKARRVMQACARVVRTGSISSPALAKWISFGLDEFSQLDRSRIMSYDDGNSGLPVHSSIRSPSSARVHGSLSEGHSPIAGLDLDMVYGNFHPNDYSRTELEETFAMSPRDLVDPNPLLVDRFEMSPPPDKELLVGHWWTGFSLVHLSNSNEVIKGTYGLHGIQLDLEPTGEVHATMGSGLKMDGVFDFGAKKIKWTNGQLWTKEEASYG